jgi:hypothetical protein
MEYLVTLIYGLVLLVFIAGLIYLAALFARGYLSTGSMSGSLTSVTMKFFGPRPEKRLAVVDQANVDGRRRLVLVRRDDVEHLIMTGGPVDVVIETGIGQQLAKPAGEVVEGPTPVYTRPPRVVGQAVGES